MLGSGNTMINETHLFLQSVHRRYAQGDVMHMCKEAQNQVERSAQRRTGDLACMVHALLLRVCVGLSLQRQWGRPFMGTA